MPVLTDKMTDIVKELKDRTSNPLFSSFLISWAIWNWRIIIGPWYLSKEDLQLYDAGNYVVFIEKQVSWGVTLIYPIVSAVLYVAIWPYIRNIVALHISMRENEGRTKRLLKSGAQSVEIQALLDNQTLHDEKMKELEIELGKNKNIRSELKSLKVSLATKDQEIEGHKAHLRLWDDTQNFTRLLGEWKIVYTDLFHNDEDSTQNLIIERKRLINSYGNERREGIVRNYFFNLTSKEISFVISYRTGLIRYYSLHRENDRMIGTENVDYNIEFIKMA